jgi:hypothetical protein
MFNLGIDLSELEEQADELTTSMQDKLYEVSRKMPQLNINQYMEQVAEDFTERPFMPLSDVWAQGLGDLFEDME